MKAETNYLLATKAYEDYSPLHAVLLLHIINARKLEPLSAHIVEQISKAMIYCGDYFEEVDSQQDPILSRTMTFLHSVMNRTAFPWITSVEDAIRISCTSHTSIPVVCPATTAICAIYYLNRYKDKYGMFTHSYYAAQRLFLVAYLVAAKYIHANLKSMVVMQGNDPLSSPSLCSTTGSSSSSNNSNVDQYDVRDTGAVYIPKIPHTTKPSSPSSSSTTITTPIRQQQREVNHISSSSGDDSEDATISEFEQNAAQLLIKLGNTLDHFVDTTQLCSMEVEFLHFIDYEISIGPSSPLTLWPWFYTIIEYYNQRYDNGLNEIAANAASASSASASATTWNNNE